MKFSELNLNDDLLKAILDTGYNSPTPIQEKAIPLILSGRDVVGCAQTGTGKTASFTLPMIELLSKGRARARMPRSLVLSPTRELAEQTASNFDNYGKYTRLTKALLIGGTGMQDQLKRLDRGVDVLIATPGRLLDLFSRGGLLLTGVSILVIDEADRMLDMGFIPDIEKLVKLLPKKRQTMMLSATMPDGIRKLADKYLNHPETVTVDAPATTAKTIEQFYINVTPRNRKKALCDLLLKENVQQTFVFCNRKRDISSVTHALEKVGFDAAPMHGDLDQKTRTETLEKLRSGDVKILVCSDVAARGIDINNVGHVVNYNVPMNGDDYVHRIGRTGRAGCEGRAFTLVDKEEQEQWDAIQNVNPGTCKVYELEEKNKKPQKKAPKVDDEMGDKSEKHPAFEYHMPYFMTEPKYE